MKLHSRPESKYEKIYLTYLSKILDYVVPLVFYDFHFFKKAVLQSIYKLPSKKKEIYDVKPYFWQLATNAKPTRKCIAAVPPSKNPFLIFYIARTSPICMRFYDSKQYHRTELNSIYKRQPFLLPIEKQMRINFMSKLKTHLEDKEENKLCAKIQWYLFLTWKISLEIVVLNWKCGFFANLQPLNRFYYHS